MTTMPDDCPPTTDFLHRLISQWEGETVEFKKTQPGGHDISEYVSALANEAYLAGRECGWYVIGVDDKTHQVTGTGYKSKAGELDALVRDIMQKTGYAADCSPFEMDEDGCRVLVFRIAAAKPGMPVYSQGHAFGRMGENLCALPKHKEDEIRFAAGRFDWSAQIVEQGCPSDLDARALQVARHLYISRKPHLEQEINGWSEMDFLERLNLLRNGKLTNAALLLLGKREALHKTGLNNTEIRWILRNHRDDTVDYEHLLPPFLISADTVYSKIRNTMYRYMTNEGIFPKEVQRYDEYTLREAINNAVAHADYMRDETIDVLEYENDRVIICNAGEFLPGTLAKVLTSTKPCSQYRNACLATAMVELDLIDKVGSGIRTMFHKQIERLFPVPEYILSEGHVQVTIQGKVLDYAFAFNLFTHHLQPAEISLLYDVFMKRRVEKEGADYLRAKGLVTGRFPHIRLASFLGEGTRDTELGQNILRRQDMSKETYIAHIRDVLQDARPRSRAEIMAAIQHHFPADFDKHSMERKMSRILHDMLETGIISKEGSTNAAKWFLPSSKKRNNRPTIDRQ